MKEIEENMRRIRAVLKETKFKPYVVTVYPNRGLIQGKYDSDAVRKLIPRWDKKIEESGYTNFSKSNIEITMT